MFLIETTMKRRYRYVLFKTMKVGVVRQQQTRIAPHCDCYQKSYLLYHKKVAYTKYFGSAIAS